MFVNLAGFFKNSTISSNSSFSSSTPATSANVILFLSAVVIILALLFPKLTDFDPPFCEFVFIAKNQNSNAMIINPNGVSKLKIVINTDSDF